MSRLQLPDLIWTRVLRFLGVNEIDVLRRTSRKLAKFCQNHVRLIYTELILTEDASELPQRNKLVVVLSDKNQSSNAQYLWTAAAIVPTVQHVWLATNSRCIWSFLGRLQQYLSSNVQMEKPTFRFLKTLHCRLMKYTEKESLLERNIDEVFQLFQSCSRVEMELFFTETSNTMTDISLIGFSQSFLLASDSSKHPTTPLRIECHFCSNFIESTVNCVLKTISECRKNADLMVVEMVKFTDRSLSRLQGIGSCIRELLKGLARRCSSVQELRLSGLDLTGSNDFLSIGNDEIDSVLGNLSSIRISSCTFNVQSLIRKLSTAKLQRVEFAGLVQTANAHHQRTSLSKENAVKLFDAGCWETLTLDCSQLIAN